MKKIALLFSFAILLIAQNTFANNDGGHFKKSKTRSGYSSRHGGPNKRHCIAVKRQRQYQGLVFN